MLVQIQFLVHVRTKLGFMLIPTVDRYFFPTNDQAIPEFLFSKFLLESIFL